jgi:glutathione peroxidase
LFLAAAVVITVAGVGVMMVRGAMGGDMQKPTDAAEGRLWDLETRSLEGESVSLADYEGRVALVVNVASKCGLTPQYGALVALNDKYEEKGLSILGFPSNDFLGQEPGTAEEIRTFCSTNYGVDFPLFEKVVVKGDEKCEIFRFLTAGGLEEPTWNFTKYLVGRDGRVIARFAPKTTPSDPELIAAVEEALGSS